MKFFTNSRRLCAALLLTLLATLPAQAFLCPIDEIYYDLNSSNYTAKVVSKGGSNYYGDIVIPEKVTFNNELYKVTEIDDKAFYESLYLNSVSIPNSIESIGTYAFGKCEHLFSLTIPESVNYIGNYAFSGCSVLYVVTIIPNYKGVNIGEHIFMGCNNLNYIKILSQDSMHLSNFDKLISNLRDKTDIVCSYHTYDWYKGHCSNKLYCYDLPFAGLNDFNEMIQGLTFSFESARNASLHYEGDFKSINLRAEINEYYGPKVVSLDSLDWKSKPILMKGLQINSSYRLYIYNDSTCIYSKSFKTKKPNIDVDYNATQTTFRIKSVTPDVDESCNAPSVEYFDGDFYFNHDKDYKNYSGGEILYSNLRPNKYYKVLRAIYDGSDVSKELMTKDISVSAKNLTQAATSLNLEGSYDTGDAKLDKIEWILGEKVVSTSKDYKPNGLVPDTKFSNLLFRVTTKSNNGEYYSKSISPAVETSALNMEILAPKNVSAKKSIVAAKTNISDEETSVGFQWKKYDAPTSLPYNEAYTAICDGQIEGVINNLQPTYYNVRAFYKDAN